MRLPDTVTSLVLDVLPLRFHLVAAAAWNLDQVWTAVLWRVGVLYGGAAGASHAEVVHQIPMPNRIDIDSGSFLVPSGSELLLTRAFVRASDPCGDAVFWDLRSGDEALRIRAVQVAALSPHGDMVVGIGDDQVADTLTFGAWSTRSGEVLWRDPPTRGNRRRVRWCPRAAFSADGGMVAALIGYELEGVGGTWSVEVWDTRGGDRLCVWDVPGGSPFVQGIRSHVLAFDGRAIVVCRGSTGPAVRLQLERLVGACRLVPAPGEAECDDVFMAGEIQLEVGGANATINTFAGVGAVYRATLPDPRGLSMWSMGKFSPDGRSALLSRGSCDMLVWRFADGRPPGRFDACLWEARFTSDSQMIVGIVFDVLSDIHEVAMFDLDARLVLRMPGFGDVKFMQIAVRDDRGW